MTSAVPTSMDGLEMVRVKRQADLVFVELNHAEKANALSPQMVDELTRVYAEDWRHAGVRALILSGAGKHFSAGADLAHLRSLRSASAEENLDEAHKLRLLFEAILRQETLTIAAVQGACVAGGCGLATAHDFVVAGSKARFLYSEVRIGFVAALVATYLPLRLRGADIRRVLLDPQFILAEEAKELGLINEVVEDAAVVSEARDLAIGMLERASSESIARTKNLLLRLIGQPLEQAFEIAEVANAEARSTADCRFGVETFLETKASPNWRADA